MWVQQPQGPEKRSGGIPFGSQVGRGYCGCLGVCHLDIILLQCQLSDVHRTDIFTKSLPGICALLHFPQSILVP